MRSILLSKSHEKLKAVYPDAVLNELHHAAGLACETFTREDILNAPTRFQNTEFIFSTWVMPAFTEEEIRKYLPSLKAVFYAAGSVQKFARPFLSCGVRIFSAWAANAVPVAEYTVAQIILANKGFFLTSRLAGDGKRKDAKDA